MTGEHRCHRPTKAGESCMRLVAAEGVACAQHTPGRQTPMQRAVARASAAEVAARISLERAEKAEAERDAHRKRAERAEARATAAEVASRGYRERAEKAEAKSARFAGLLAHQSRTLTDTIAAEVLRQKADAWDEGHHAGHEEARAVHPTYPDPTPNPYRQTEGA